MIYLKLSGGLGNQMFQLATAKALSIDLHCQISVDISDFSKKESESYTKRQFELGHVFNTDSIKIAKIADYGYLFKSDLFSRIKRKLTGGTAFFETSARYQSDIKNITRNTYLEGYFQSEKYFIHHREAILNLFEFIGQKSEKTIEFAEKIKSENAIAIHIRRGDYVAKKEINAVHGALPLSYYQEALTHFDLEKHHCFIFSDDINWVEEHFTFIAKDKIKFIDWNSGDSSWQDMFLMSKCKHFIIANSSFSWWGAWLSQYSAKKVIAPKKWFNDEQKNKLTNDLIPDNWLKI